MCIYVWHLNQKMNPACFYWSFKQNVSHKLTMCSIAFSRFEVKCQAKCFLTCIRASGKLMEKASLSLIPTSGYWVCWKAFSRACSCDTVKAVRLRRCFCWLPYRASRISSGRTETCKMSLLKYTLSQQQLPSNIRFLITWNISKLIQCLLSSTVDESGAF